MAWPLASCGQPGAHLQRAVAAAAAHAQPQPLLLCGPSQSGKTRLAHSLAAALACPLHACSAGRLAVSHPGRPDAGLTAAFVSAALAARAAPSRAAVLLLDGLDALLSAREARASDGDWDALRALALGCAALAAQQQHPPEEAAEGAAGGGAPPRVWVVATCAEPAALHAQALAQFSAPGSVVRLGPPAPSERGAMLLAALRSTPGLRACAAAVEAEAGALAGVAEGGAHGFLAGDLAAVAQDLALALAGAGAREGASSSSECGAAAGPGAAPPSLCSLLRSLVACRTPLLLVLGEGAAGRGGGYSGAGGGSAAGRELAGALRGAGWQLPAAVTDVQDFRGAAALAASGAGGHLVRGTTAAAAAASAAASGSASDPGAGGGGGGGGAGAPLASLLSGLAAALRPTLPAVAWQDVKGQAAAKASLQQLLRLSSAPAPAPAPSPAPAPAPPPPRPSGILLYGPPGTGKTLLAKAAATALGARFINISIPSVLRAGLGDSEAALARAFDLARATAPSLVFMDEVQALFGARSGGGGGGGGGGEEDADTARLAANLTATLLHCLDAVRGQGVTVLAATNVPSALDAGLLRPGRLDRAVYVGLPTSGDRRELLAGVVAGVQCSGGGEAACGGAWAGVRSAAALLELLVAATEGFSGADCAALGRRAAGVAVRRSGALAELLRSVYGGGGGGGGWEEGGRAAEGAECALTPACFYAALHGDEEGGLRAMAPSVSSEAEAAVKGWRRAR